MTYSGIRRVLSIQAAAALLCFAVEFYCRYALHLPSPYVRPLLGGQYRFPDFTLLREFFEHYHTLRFFHVTAYHFMYPAPAAMVYEPFMLLGHHGTTAFVSTAILLVFSAACAFARGLVLRGSPAGRAALIVTAGIALSYPLWFEWDRGNIEIFVWGIVALGVWAFYRRREYTAAACFGIAASIKLYPVVYLGLFIQRRQWKQIGLGVLIAAVVTVIGLWLMYPNVLVSFRETAIGIRQFDEVFVQHVRGGEIGFDHSLFSLKRFVHPTVSQLRRASGIYVPVTACAGIALFFGRIMRMPLANQVLALTVAMILLPPVSFDYTLLHLYTPLCLILLTVRGVPLVLPLLALAASPLTEFIRHEQSYGGQIRAVLLLCIFTAALVWPLRPAPVEQ